MLFTYQRGRMKELGKDKNVEEFSANIEISVERFIPKQSMAEHKH